MDRLQTARHELNELDELAAGASPIHRLHPLCKLFVAVVYITTVVSFPKYSIAPIVCMFLFPAVLYQLAGLSIGMCFHKLRHVLPLVCAVGLINPFLDHTPVMLLPGISVSGGVISMLTLIIKGLLTLTASFLLIATTPIDRLCASLRLVHVPGVITTLLLLTYRYIALMIDEVSIMMQAYRLRAPGQKGLHISAWGSFLGQLLLRSIDRAGELYTGMQLRGFQGEFRFAEPSVFTLRGCAGTVITAALILLPRYTDLAGLIGRIFVR